MRASVVVAERSAEAAEDTAKAAILNAQAALRAELPIVSVERIELHKAPPACGKINGGYPPPGDVVLVIDFQNNGRTPAELIALNTSWPITQAIPLSPIFKFDSKYPYMPGTYMEANGGKLRRGPAKFFFRLSTDEAKAIEEGSKFLWAFGYLSFLDFMGDRHERYFGAKWIPYHLQPDGSMLPLGFAFEDSIPSAYNRST
jgi:hypothetical protein